MSEARAAKKPRLTGPGRKKPPMHSGRWTPEEEQYVEGMISEFNAGLLPITEGTTLRSFLAKMLNCNPKRVSKKYDGNPIYNGKSSYVRTKTPLPSAQANARQENLLELERKFREALSTMQRVESRLKSLTSHMMPDSKKSSTGAAGVLEDSFTNSAVSSLTADDDEGAMEHYDEPITNASNRMNEAPHSVAQVSSGDSKQASVSDEEAAGHMLLQLNASSRPADENPSGLASNLIEAPLNREEIKLKPVHQPQAESQQESLQRLLQELNQYRRTQEPTVQQPVITNQTPNLQGYLSLSGTPPNTGEMASPIRQPQNTQQNLQGFLQSLQRQQAGQPTTSSVVQQLSGSRSQTTQQPQQQPDLQGVLRLLQQPQQQKPQPQPEPTPKVNLEGLLQSLVQQRQPPVAAPEPPQSQSNQVFEHLMRQITRGNSKASTPPPPQQSQQQRNVQSILLESISQNTSRTNTVNQGFVNSTPVAPPQSSQQNAAQLVSALVDQLRQNLSELQPQTRSDPNVQGLLQNLMSAYPQPQQPQPTPKPQAASQGSLHEMLRQLVAPQGQQQTNQLKRPFM